MRTEMPPLRLRNTETGEVIEVYGADGKFDVPLGEWVVYPYEDGIHDDTVNLMATAMLGKVRRTIIIEG